MPSQWRLLRAASYASRQSPSAAAKSFRTIAPSICWSLAFQAIHAALARARAETTSRVAARSAKPNVGASRARKAAFMFGYMGQGRYHPEKSSETERYRKKGTAGEAVGGQELNTTLTA